MKDPLIVFQHQNQFLDLDRRRKPNPSKSKLSLKKLQHVVRERRPLQPANRMAQKRLQKCQKREKLRQIAPLKVNPERRRSP